MLISLVRKLEQSVSSIHGPKCRKCGGLMWLAGIERDDKPDHEKHTFQCTECEHYDVLVLPQRGR
jgi:hypothetical protein